MSKAYSLKMMKLKEVMCKYFSSKTLLAAISPVQCPISVQNTKAAQMSYLYYSKAVGDMVQQELIYFSA
jgi:hypothetical protein